MRERRDLHRRQALRGRVGGHVLAGRDELAGLRVLVDPEAAVALVLAGQQQPRARAVAALEPRLVEERDGHRPGLVGDARLDERLHPAPAHLPARDRAHLDDDRRDLVDRQLSDRARGAAIARDVLEQVADALEPEPLRPPSRPSRRGAARRVAAATASGSAARSPPRPAAGLGWRTRSAPRLEILTGGADRAGLHGAWLMV